MNSTEEELQFRAQAVEANPYDDHLACGLALAWNADSTEPLVIEPPFGPFDGKGHGWIVRSVNDPQPWGEGKSLGLALLAALDAQGKRALG